MRCWTCSTTAKTRPRHHSTCAGKTCAQPGAPTLLLPTGYGAAGRTCASPRLYTHAHVQTAEGHLRVLARPIATTQRRDVDPTSVAIAQRACGASPACVDHMYLQSELIHTITHTITPSPQYVAGGLLKKLRQHAKRTVCSSGNRDLRSGDVRRIPRQHANLPPHPETQFFPWPFCIIASCSISARLCCCQPSTCVCLPARIPSSQTV
jgi:hypothetical protein